MTRTLSWVESGDRVFDAEVPGDPVKHIIYRDVAANGPMGKYDIIEVHYNDTMIIIPAHMANAWGYPCS